VCLIYYNNSPNGNEVMSVTNQLTDHDEVSKVAVPKQSPANDLPSELTNATDEQLLPYGYAVVDTKDVRTISTSLLLKIVAMSLYTIHAYICK